MGVWHFWSLQTLPLGNASRDGFNLIKEKKKLNRQYHQKQLILWCNPEGIYQ